MGRAGVDVSVCCIMSDVMVVLVWANMILSFSGCFNLKVKKYWLLFRVRNRTTERTEPPYVIRCCREASIGSRSWWISSIWSIWAETCFWWVENLSLVLVGFSFNSMLWPIGVLITCSYCSAFYCSLRADLWGYCTCWLDVPLYFGLLPLLP